MGTPSFANDVAILIFATSITIGGNVGVATLPVDNSNDYAGLTCVLSGWGYTSKNADILFINYIGRPTINHHEFTIYKHKEVKTHKDIIFNYMV